MSKLGFDSDTVQARLSNPDDAAIGRVLGDEALAGRLGINATPAFVLLVDGQRPVAANQRMLSSLLSSPLVQRSLQARAAQLEQ
jgi:predicted DsbA family dithiol-disulfide isomerase